MSGVHDAGYRPSAWGTAGDHESRIRKIEANPPGDLAVTDGSTTVDPTTEIYVGPGLALTDLGSGVAGLAGGGSVIGWMAADIGRGSSAIAQLVSGDYAPVWANASVDSGGASCGTLSSSSTVSHLVVPAGNYQFWLAIWTSVNGQPQFTNGGGTGTSRSLGDSQAYTLTSIHPGQSVVFGVYSTTATLNTRIEPLSFTGDPTADAFASMFVMRFAS